MSAGLFATWQPVYAAHNIPVFPVRNKRPAVRGYMTIGLRASAQFALKFRDADAFGFVAGARNKITVVDIDSPDERILAGALDRFGSTPVIVRSGGGNFQAWYRNNGEGRRIRPDPRSPIDILGNGFTVAPPSQGTRGRYEFVEGGLDDLHRLPTLRPQNDARPVSDQRSDRRISIGARNNALFEYLLRQARYCDDFDALLAVGMTFREQALEFDPRNPVTDAEVVATARSVWKYEVNGENRFGRLDKAEDFIGQVDAFFLLKFLRQENHGDREFMVANGLAGHLNWSRKRLAAARRMLIESGHLEQVRAAHQRQPALFRFT